MLNPILTTIGLCRVIASKVARFSHLAPVSRKLACAILFVSAVMSLGGCNNASKGPDDSAPQPPPVSNIPLRIRIVGTVTTPEFIERRWLSGSEQSIDIQSQGVDDFLASSSCDADVVLFPARLIGELVERDWIAKLPNLEYAQSDEADLEEARTFPDAWLSQCTYGGVTYALPLGCSITNFIASESYAAPLQAAESDREPVDSLETLLVALPQAKNKATRTLDADVIDRNALVDRFLALTFALTDRKTQYGVLLDLETMQPRLTEPEFQRAAEWLCRLAEQPGGGDTSTIASHSAAWSWASQNDQATLSIAAANQLNEEAAKITDGAMINVPNAQLINSGGGMLAAIAVSCRQSHQSNLFMKWLVEPQTSQFLSPLITGIDSPTPINIESLAWRIQQGNAQVVQNDQLPQEPRMPGAHEMRMKLADELLAMLSGSKNPDQSLSDAQRGWEAMLGSNRDAIKLHYQQSLGLKDESTSY